WLLFWNPNTRIPLYLTIISNLLNIALNYYFVYEMKLNIDGVAYATVIAQYLAFFAGILIILKTNPSTIQWKDIFHYDSFMKIIKVNGDIFVRTLCLIASFSLFTIYSSKQSDQILAVNSLLMQFYGFLSYGMDGLALAAETLIAKYIGIKDRQVLKSTIHKIWISSIYFSVFYALCFYLFFDITITMMTHHQSILVDCRTYMFWIVISPLINSPAYILDGIFLGSISSKHLRNAMLVSFVVVFLPSLIYFPSVFANHGLWLAISLFMVARSITLAYYYPKLKF
ncbi:MATE family efflux transporter, partial [bacterium]|nr:MATE family efflux transporter [bacterium]